MENVKTILLHRSVYADNDYEADQLRAYLKAKGVFVVNLMSSPGAGKTTTLTALINKIKDKAYTYSKNKVINNALLFKLLCMTSFMMEMDC